MKPAGQNAGGVGKMHGGGHPRDWQGNNGGLAGLARAFWGFREPKTRIPRRDEIDVGLIRQEWSAVAAGEEARTAWLEDAMARVLSPHCRGEGMGRQLFLRGVVCDNSCGAFSSLFL